MHVSNLISLIHLRQPLTTLTQRLGELYLTYGLAYEHLNNKKREFHSQRSWSNHVVATVEFQLVKVCVMPLKTTKA